MPVVGYYVTKDGAPCALNKQLHAKGVLVPARKGEDYHVFALADERTVAPSGKRPFAYIRAMRAIERTRKSARWASDTFLKDSPAFRALLQRGRFEIVSLIEREASATLSRPAASKRRAAVQGGLFGSA